MPFLLVVIIWFAVFVGGRYALDYYRALNFRNLLLLYEASSFIVIVPLLAAAGHDPAALTLAGLGLLFTGVLIPLAWWALDGARRRR